MGNMLNNNIRIYFTFVFLVGFLFYSPGCKTVKLDEPGSLNTDDIIQVDAVPATVNANGVDRVKITATLLGDSPDGKIVFKTDFGTFAGNNQQQFETATVGHQAEVFLISSIDVIKEVTVTASIESITASTIVEFIRVLPVRIFLTSNVTRLKADGNSTATITATLVPPENIGIVSKGARVIFDAIDAETGAAVPQLYREALSGAEGKASAAFVSHQPGLMEITCRVDGLADVTATFLIEFYEEDSQ